MLRQAIIPHPIAGDLPWRVTDAAGPKIELLSTSEIAAIEPELEQLNAAAAEQNPFYSPALLMPALRTFADLNVRIAVIRDKNGLVIALLPIRRFQIRAPFPFFGLANWTHPHCFLGSPLVRAGAEDSAASALLDLADGDGLFLRLRRQNADGSFFAALLSSAERRGRDVRVAETYDRALLRGGFEADRYLASVVRKKKLKELKRQRCRLQEYGVVSFDELGPNDDLSEWRRDFLLLECAGWKGRAGTALAQCERSSRFFSEAIGCARERNILRMHKLSLDGRPIAMIVTFIENGEGFSFKIAYDEAFARFSPGVLLELDLLKALEEEPDLSFVDSCACAEHSMIDGLWSGRRRIGAIDVGRSDVTGKAAFRALSSLVKLRASLRTLTGRRR